MTLTIPTSRDFSLDDRFRVEEGQIYLTSMQAIVRLLLDQQRADRRSGLKTGGFVSGYPGSPVGGLDLELNRRGDLLREHDVVFVPGLNEDLAATAVFGSQTVSSTPGTRVQGVYSLWFGKAPGVDRSGDAFRHANMRGTARYGGVLAVAGDDPDARSSMLPTDSNQAFYDWAMPIMFPGDVQDILDLGLHGYALSRASGLAIGFKIVTNVADGAGSAVVAPGRIVPQIPTVDLDGMKFVPRLRLNEAGPPMRDAERELMLGRLELARAYIRANGLNAVTVAPSRARIGLISAGSTYFELRKALHQLQLDDAALQTAGIRVLKLGAVWPIDREEIRTFARGLKEIIVVEDKRPFIEMFVKDALYGQPRSPAVVGKQSPDGEEFLPAHGEVTADVMSPSLGRRLGEVWDVEPAKATLARGTRRYPESLKLSTARTPFFCSGCPHNSSLHAPEGAMVGAGIGCHVMALTMPRPEYGDVTGYTQMGGEGAQWIGMAPFTETPHMFQNLGDGTFHHSGSLAIRYAVASKVNITYKLLYNSAVGMTGGQDVEGAMSVPALTSSLRAEGVARIIVTTDDPSKYKYVRLARDTQVWHRRRLLEAQEVLAATPGVTVLIHDQQCAAEKRRLRKRAKQADPTLRVHINERVCEGCGDCGRKSQCLSVQPVETTFGRKTRIHQSSCNVDYSCLQGDCPSFVTVETRKASPPSPRGLTVAVPDLPAPAKADIDGAFSIYMTGIGGTGVVTASQILATAATLEGKLVRDLDLTGSSQKAGPVVSQLQIFHDGDSPAATISAGQADLFLGFDILGAVNPSNLEKLSPGKTAVAVSTSATPTGTMSIDPSLPFPDQSMLLTTLGGQAQPGKLVSADATYIAESLCGTHMVANIVLIGAALQAGMLPVSAQSIEDAIGLNGAAVEANLAALNWGRVAVADFERLSSVLQPDRPKSRAQDDQAGDMVARLVVDGELARTLQVCTSDLIGYQGRRYAAQYVGDVGIALDRTRRAGASESVVDAYARSLHKLLAYKDEYEVARLLLDSSSKEAIRQQFGEGSKVYWNLHPPVLRSLGLDRKVRLGPWFKPALETLRVMRVVRGTGLDPFGRAAVRRVERALIAQYRAMMDEAFSRLTGANATTVKALAEAPDLIRGYEQVKLENVKRYVQTSRSLAATLMIQTHDALLVSLTE